MTTPAKPRKEQILEVAERHFAQHGFAGASLSAVARDCELGNPGLLHHFASKELLYRALLETLAQDLMQRMDQMLADTAARTMVAPLQLPVGVLTALIGVPVFLFLLTRQPK